MSNQGATVTVLYPRKEGSSFDIDYYLSTHMPLVDKHWKEHGLKSWHVTKLGDDAPYTYSCAMEFESPEAFGKAIASPGTAEVMGDVPKFSKEQPVLIHGPIIGRRD